MTTLKITYENAKLKGIYHFSLPSGYTCPGAKNCKTFADRRTGKITDKQTEVNGKKFRCYAAMDEARRPNVRGLRWDNFEKIKACKSVKEMTALIVRSVQKEMPPIGGVLRVHIGGDFFKWGYFKAWLYAAQFLPKITFYSYTKSVHFLARYLKENELPENYVFTCSKGGKFDNLIPVTKTKTADIFFSQAEIDALGLETDHTDELAISSKDSFALLLHGSQPAGTKASTALKNLKKKGFAGYGAK